MNSHVCALGGRPRVRHQTPGQRFVPRVLGIVSTMGSFRERTTDGRSKLDASRR
jgi:hypothetical protein